LKDDEPDWVLLPDHPENENPENPENPEIPEIPEIPEAPLDLEPPPTAPSELLNEIRSGITLKSTKKPEKQKYDQKRTKKWLNGNF